MTIIVTDSTAYLTRSETTILGVRVVNMSYSLDGAACIRRAALRKTPPARKWSPSTWGRLRTSQAGFSAFMSVFDDLILAGHDVLCLTISSRLSGTYGNARIAARETAPDKIEVVDSLTTGGGLYLLIKEARRLLDGGLTVQETAQRLRVLRGRVKTVFSVEDISALRSSGRLGNVKMSVATILNIKPMLKCLDGGIVSCGITRGRHEQLSTLMRFMARLTAWLCCKAFRRPARSSCSGSGFCKRAAAFWNARRARCWASILAVAAWDLPGWRAERKTNSGLMDDKKKPPWRDACTRKPRHGGQLLFYTSSKTERLRACFFSSSG